MNHKTKIILTVSLIVNVLLLGVIGGHALKHMNHDKYKHKSHMLERIAKDLPENKQAEIAEKIEAYEAKKKLSREDGRKVREELLEILAAPEFYAGLYRQKAAELRENHAKKWAGMEDLMVNIAQDLSQAERQQIVEQMRKRHKKWKRKE